MPGETAAGAGTAGAGTGAAAATGGAGTAAAGAGAAAATGAATGAGTGVAAATGAATGAGTAAAQDWLAPAPATLDLKLPDGVAKTEVLGDYSTAAAKWVGKAFTAEAAQEILNAVAPKFAQAGAAAQKSLSDGWEKERVADKEVGGANLAASNESARLGLEKFASPALRKMLEENPIGRHPEVFRLFVKIGQELRQRVSEDRSGVRQIHGGGAGAGGNAALFDHPASRAVVGRK